MYTLTEAYVSYDHPFHAPVEHALNIDFVNPAQERERRGTVKGEVAGNRLERFRQAAHLAPRLGKTEHT